MIEYLIGDATDPQTPGRKIISHICNDVGGWGAGFVLAVSARWSEPETAYRDLHPNNRTLGLVQFVGVEPDTIVTNMIAQTGYGNGNRNSHRTNDSDSTPPIRYDALEVCLKKVADYALTYNTSVHMPRIGCGLGGGKWALVEPIVAKTLDKIQVFVYDPNTRERAKHEGFL